MRGEVLLCIDRTEELGAGECMREYSVEGGGLLLGVLGGLVGSQMSSPDDDDDNI